MNSQLSKSQLLWQPRRWTSVQCNRKVMDSSPRQARVSISITLLWEMQTTKAMKCSWNSRFWLSYTPNNFFRNHAIDFRYFSKSRTLFTQFYPTIPMIPGNIYLELEAQDHGTLLATTKTSATTSQICTVTMKNRSFAFFAAVLNRSTTWNDLFCICVDDLRKFQFHHLTSKSLILITFQNS